MSSSLAANESTNYLGDVIQLKSPSLDANNGELVPQELHGLISLIRKGASAELIAARLSQTKFTHAWWRSLAQFSDSKYVRTRIYIDHDVEMLLLGWLPEQLSPVHNHKNSKCWVKVLEGTGTEIGFSKRDNSLTAAPSVTTTATDGMVLYAEDDDLHSMGNLHSTPLVTLHIYSPPLAQMEVIPLEQTSVSLLVQAYEAL